jgi:glycogen debranching enzyme
MAKTRKGDQPSIQIPASGSKKERKDDEETLITPVTPKTPADEGIDFFEAGVIEGEAPIRVYELRLDADGGPSKELSVCR